MKQIMKWCGAGQHEQPLNQFWKRKGKLQPNCKTCQSSINKKRYKRYRKAHIQNVIENSRQRMKVLQQWKQTLKCVLCGESHSTCLDFHHLDPNAKDFTIGEAFWKYGIDRVAKEVRKCVVVCKNCHAKVHDNVLAVSREQCCDPSLLEEMTRA